MNQVYLAADPKLRPFLAGFRRKCICAEQLHILRQIIDGYYQKQLITCANIC